MDLNLLYSQHQIALMKASTATDVFYRDMHLDSATAIGRVIGSYQEACGAQASRSWHDDHQPRPCFRTKIAEATSL